MSFFGLEGFNQSIPSGVRGVDGSIIIPCRRRLESVTSKTFPKGEYRRRLLFDPQLYLTELEPARCRARCESLATYGWFDVGDLELQKTGRSRTTQKKWRDKAKSLINKYWTRKLPEGNEIDDAVRSVAATQQMIGCEAIILAAPLTSNPNSDLGLELEWLDRGIAVTRQGNMLGVPILASVALAERVLTGIDPFENSLIDTIIDQLSTREVDGVYITMTSTSNLYYVGSAEIVGALLRLVDGFKRAGLKRVVVNYLTVAGLLTMAVGADTICTGFYRSERRLNLEELPDPDSNALAYPAFYCHRAATEINVGDDLKRTASAGAMDDFADETTYSKDLLRVLRRGGDPKEVPQWEYRAGNTPAARSHFTAAIGREAAALAALDAHARIGYAKTWLSTAEARAEQLIAIGAAAGGKPPLHPRTEVTHQEGWRKAFENFLTHRSS